MSDDLSGLPDRDDVVCVLTAHVKKLESRLDSVLALHSDATFGWCPHCKCKSPCPTLRAAEGKVMNEDTSASHACSLEWVAPNGACAKCARDTTKKVEDRLAEVNKSIIQYFQEEHLEGDGPEIDRWKARLAVVTYTIRRHEAYISNLQTRLFRERNEWERRLRVQEQKIGEASAQDCRCHECGENYREDVKLSDEMWDLIRPDGKLPGAGLLCGGCIGKRLEAHIAAVVTPAKALCAALDLVGSEIEDAADTDNDWGQVSEMARLTREALGVAGRKL